MKSHMNLFEVQVAGQDVPDAQLPHDGEARKVRERDSCFVPIAETQGVGFLEPLRRDALNGL